MSTGLLSSLSRLGVFTIGLAVLTPVLYSQGTSGNITGRVLDPTGAAIPAARIVARNTSTNVETATTSTDTGDYNLVVYPGVFEVAAEATGFKRYLRENVIVTASATVRLDTVLEIGALTETVEVSGALLTVQSENAKISTAVENKFVDELPLVVGGRLRNPYDLVQIAAQVTTKGVSDMSLGGAPTRSWNATLDGLSIATNRSADQAEIAFQAPSLEAITEFAVDTGGFKAEFGQAGGGIMTFSSKSGTNDFHGTVYNFLRNEALDARRFFEDKKSVYKQNDFGAAGGGPVIIPKIYNGRNRTFFYVTYEGFRNRAGSNDTILTVPTPEMYEGDFSNWVNQQGTRLPIYDPRTTRPGTGGGFVRDPYPNNVDSENTVQSVQPESDTVCASVKPNRGGQPGTIGYVTNNWITGSGTILEPQDKGSLKFDHNLTDSHRLAFFTNITSFRREAGASGPPGLPLPLWNGEVQEYDSSSYRLSWDWVVNPTTLNHFSIGGNTFDKVSFSPAYGTGWKEKLCFPNVINCDVNFPISPSPSSAHGAPPRAMAPFSRCLRSVTT